MAALPLLHGGKGTACELQAVVHGRSEYSEQSVNGAGATPADTQRCIVCYWLRSIRAIQDEGLPVATTVASSPVATVSVAQPRLATVSRWFARAPPLA